VVTAVSVSCR